MTLLIPAASAVALTVTVLAGPVLIRAAAPALMRVPRAAVALLVGAGVLWLFALAALSLMAAWLITGPAVLPTALADVCQRCLAAASPFDMSGIVDTGVPVALLIALPAVALTLLAGVVGRRAVRRHRATVATANDIWCRAEPTRIHGHPVLLIDDLRPTAYSLPLRHGGIVVSRGLLTALDPAEVAAVLAHEHAHVRGRHHLVLALLDVLVAPLRRLPLMAAIRDAVPHYLEIAADAAARRHAGTPALASALLKMGDPAVACDHRHGSLLHAAGPDRIGQLVAPARIGSALAPVSALGAAATAFAMLTAAVHGPYLSVILTGCQPLS